MTRGRNELHKTILIADDDADTALTLTMILKAFQYEVECAHDGANALAQARRRIPYAIVLDVALPITDGFDVLREVKADPRMAEVLIVGHSAHVGLDFCRRACAGGMDYYLPKPIEPDVLLACLAPEKYNAILATILIISEMNQLDSESLCKPKALSRRAAHAVASAMAHMH